MARAGRVCGVPRCPAVAVRAGKCQTHLREAESARGTSTERSYGWDHQKARRAALRALRPGQRCPVCLDPLDDGTPLELGHSTPLRQDPTPRPGDQLVHARCNPKGEHPFNTGRPTHAGS